MCAFFVITERWGKGNRVEFHVICWLVGITLAAKMDLKAPKELLFLSTSGFLWSHVETRTPAITRLCYPRGQPFSASGKWLGAGTLPHALHPGRTWWHPGCPLSLGTLLGKGGPRALQWFIPKLARKEMHLKAVVWKWPTLTSTHVPLAHVAAPDCCGPEVRPSCVPAW